jgi:PAS domain S-box-containing protein
MEPFATERGVPEPVLLDARRAIEQVRDEAVFLLDRHGRITSWNEGVRLILGWEPQDWIGQPVQVVFTPEDAAAGVPQAEMQQAARAGCADDKRWMRRKGGERFFALGSMTRMLDERGAHVGYLKALRDFTRARQAQEERERLLASQTQAKARAETVSGVLAAAMDALSEGILIGDAQGISRCNGSALQLLGAASLQDLRQPPEQLIRQFRLRRQQAGPLLPAGEWPFAPALQGQRQVIELWATHASTDAEILLSWACVPITQEGGAPGLVAVLRDLSGRLQLDESGRALSRVQHALQERDAEWRAVTWGVRDYAIFTIDPEGCIASWHQGAERIKGYTAQEAIGMPFAELFTPEDRAAGRPQAEMAIAERSGEYKGQGVRLRKDGSRFESAVVLTALRGHRGELLGFLKLTQDITERRRQEDERERMLCEARAARDDAERTSHSKGEFVATISHELRTPLSAILGWAHVLERGTPDAETVRHGLEAIARNARLQVQLIDDLLDMNRIESGQLRLELQLIELGGVIAAAVDSALPAASARKIGLRTVFGPTADPVLGDAARLQQVVANLLNNAIKFTPPGGQVSVSLTHSGEQAQIKVVDNGQGIAPEFMAAMFDRFRQQDASTTRRHGGLGIGLSIVRHLVQLHGGTVAAHSAGLGQGATFIVTLPAVAAASRLRLDAARPPEPSATIGLDGIEVLLVDDEADVRAVTARLLRDAGAQVRVAAGVDEAMDLLRAARPAVILSDIGMPRVDGHEFIRRVRALPLAAGGQTPAAAFTAYTRPEDRERALAAGYQMHLAKPVAPDTLVAAVAALARSAPPAAEGQKKK